MPGESYLDVLDALHDADIALTVCRQEGGAAMMAEAHGKLTGEPGICFVTRGPGATNASPGVHVAAQDSTPMILFVGQVRRDTREREGFQELDYRAVFGSMTKWATEIDDPARIPELVSRAFHVATNGRPGPVVVALPEDVLTGRTAVADAPPYRVAEPAPSEADLAALAGMLAAAERPLLVAGGSRWTRDAVDDLAALSSALSLPVATSFRRQALFPASHPCFAGELGVACEPGLVTFAREADLLLLVGGRLSEMPSQGWTLLGIPDPGRRLVHVHPGSEELGRVYRADLAINTSPTPFVKALGQLATSPGLSAPAASWRERTAARHAERRLWSEVPPDNPDAFDLAFAVRELARHLPPDTIVANGAGNYATWVHRFYPFERFGTQLAPTSGSMGYGVPAAVAAARLDPTRSVVAFAGDGCFLMNGQEFATAVQYALPIVVIVVDNGMYGTIRMHQERSYPGRVSGTSLVNPDFAALAAAFGGHGERVERSDEFLPALERARASGKPAILHCLVSPDRISVGGSLATTRAAARAAAL